MIGPGPEMAFQGVDPSFFHSPVNPNDPLRMAQSVCPCNDVPNELKGMSKEDIEKEIAEKITKYKATFEPGDYLPEVSPHPLVFGKDPRDPTAICAPRNVYASKKDKNYEGGSNLIRGDIPIMPGSVVSNVSAKPHQRLARGAMQTGILGGDIPTILSAGDMFVYNTRYDAGYDRLQLMAGEGNCGAVSYLKS